MAGYNAAISAALYGPENKGISIHGHGFNVKKLSLDWTATQVIAKGQISHKLRWRPDDQIYFTIVVDRADFSVDSVVTEVDRNPLADFAVINHLIGSFIVGLFVPAAGAALGASGPIVEGIVQRAEDAAVGNWQQACQALIAAIAASLSVALAAGEIKAPGSIPRPPRGTPGRPDRPTPGGSNRPPRHVQ